MEDGEMEPSIFLVEAMLPDSRFLRHQSSITAALIKRQLLDLQAKECTRIFWENEQVGLEGNIHRGSLMDIRNRIQTLSTTTITLESDDPLELDPVVISSVRVYSRCRAGVIIRSTMVRCLSAKEDDPQPLIPTDILHNHGRTTIQTLKLHISTLLRRPILIGTTRNAMEKRRKALPRLRALHEAYRIELAAENESAVVEPRQVTPSGSGGTGLLKEGALIVHSPYRGAGKTLLVRKLAQELGATVHVLQAGDLFAMYETDADAAFEMILHSIVLRAAVTESAKVCIILDHLQSFVKPMYRGDGATAVLNSMAALLKNLTQSIKQRNEFPFPRKDQLYNLCQQGGITLPVYLCIVGIESCPDNATFVLQSLDGARYHLPDLTAMDRWNAFRIALEDLTLSSETQERLMILAASSVSVRGALFAEIASRIRRGVAADKVVTQDVLNRVFATIRASSSVSNADVSFVVTKGSAANDVDLFASVGGNVQAKLALGDALALEPQTRRLLKRFWMHPPTGVLLYGPPGTGKTMLARAVAKLLQSPSTGLGGTFISLEASNIVQAEIGTSEKKLVSAFDTARSNAPSVIFLDEFQALFTERSAGGSGKLASTLLQCLDEVVKWSSVDEGMDEGQPITSRQRVIVLGATNAPWLVDKAFLRAGRFDRVVHVGLPNLDERKAVLRVHLQRMRLSQETTVDSLSEQLAPRTESFSGADIAALCRAAAVKCLTEDGEEGRVNGQHFFESLLDINPSSEQDLVDRLSQWRA